MGTLKIRILFKSGHVEKFECEAFSAKTEKGTGKLIETKWSKITGMNILDIDLNEVAAIFEDE